MDNKRSYKFYIALGVLICAALVVVCIFIFLIFNTPKADSQHQEDFTEQPRLAEETQKSTTPETNQADTQKAREQAIAAALSKLSISYDYRASLTHGPKTSQYQKYIVLHDTEGDGNATGVVNYWDNNGKGTGAHFVINKDGSIVQCVKLDEIAHHAGFGDSGHNSSYGVAEDGRDDRKGTQSVGAWASDYGMNSWSIGIEMVHVGGSGGYPQAQLNALDNLISYLDTYYSNTSTGNAGTIIDHKMWRTGNSDTSPEFANYLANYRANRKHS